MFRLVSLVLCALLPGCASLGLTDRDRQYQLAHAEPLFGKALDRCLDDPAVLLAAIQNAPTDKSGTQSKANKDGTPPPPSIAVPEGCKQLVEQIRPAVQLSARTANYNNAEMQALDIRPRNELIDALIAISNRKCSDYAAYLKTHDGQTNGSLGILALLTGGMGSLVSDLGTSQAFSGASAMFTGTRSALNETWFSNQTIHVLVSGFEKVREREMRAISNKKACPIEHYGVMAGIGDTLGYHGACSLLAGLSEAAEAIERSDQPGLETMRRQLADLEAIRAQAYNITDAPIFSSSPVEYELARAVEAAQRAVNETEADFREAQQNYTEVIAGDYEAPEDQVLEDQIARNKENRDRLEEQLETRKRTLQDARTALNTERTRREQDAQNAAASRTNPSPLTGTTSAIAICPFTGRGLEASGTNSATTRPGQ